MDFHSASQSVIEVDIMTDMEVDMVADMEVDKAADMDSLLSKWLT